MKLAVSALVVVLAALAAPAGALADVFVVNTTVDLAPDKSCDAPDCTLREAVDLAQPTDSITVPAGTYVLSRGELTLVGDKIDGAGARATIIDGGGNSRVMSTTNSATGGVTSRVAGVTIRGGNGKSADATGGGGVLVRTGTLALTNSQVVDNTSVRGGGIGVGGGAWLLMVGSTVARNIAADGRLTRGGGIAVAAEGHLLVGNSTISGNIARDTPTGNSSEGGGISTLSGTQVLLTGVTIAGNQASAGGGVHLLSGAASREMHYTILAGNTALAGAACAGDGPATMTTDHNLVQDGTCTLQGTGDVQGVDAALGVLGNNGGPTDTRAIGPTSPAIDKGSCNGVDQRGVARPANACDAGAFEYVAPTLRVATTVVNDNGGTRVASNFTIHVRTAAGGEAPNSPQSGSAAGTTFALSPGNFVVASDGMTGYTFSISGDCTAAGAVSLAESQAKTCTITANDVAPRLTVIADVVNDEGGTSTAANFSVHVRRGASEVAGSPQAGSATGTAYTLSAGGHSVSADGVSGYAASVSGACAANGTITLQVGDVKTCTIKLDDGAPTLKVVTAVINDNGGTMGPANFVVHVRSGGADAVGSPQAGDSNGTVYSLEAGSYTVAADAASGYVASVSGDCAADGSIALPVGEQRTCTVTTNDVAQPPPPPPLASFQLPPPVIGKQVNLLRAQGTVTIKRPGTTTFVPLEVGEQLPVGTIVDTLKGRVTLIAARDKNGGTAKGVLRRHLQDRADQGPTPDHGPDAGGEAVAARKHGQGERGGQEEEEAAAVG